HLAARVLGAMQRASRNLLDQGKQSVEVDAGAAAGIEHPETRFPCGVERGEHQAREIVDVQVIAFGRSISPHVEGLAAHELAESGRHDSETGTLSLSRTIQVGGPQYDRRAVELIAPGLDEVFCRDLSRAMV